MSIEEVKEKLRSMDSGYENNWKYEREDDDTSIGSELPRGYYPTPHFNLAINMRETPPTWLQNVGQILNAIESIRPINTVFERFQGFYDSKGKQSEVVGFWNLRFQNGSIPKFLDH